MSLDGLVQLDMVDMLVRREGVDRVLRKVNTIDDQILLAGAQYCAVVGGTHEKPLIKLYSWPILPPLAMASSLVLETSKYGVS